MDTTTLPIDAVVTTDILNTSYFTALGQLDCNNDFGFYSCLNNPPSVILTSNDPICEGEDLMLDENGGDGETWNWTGPNAFTAQIQSPTISNVTTAAGGTYNITVTDEFGCSDNDQIIVTVHPTPTANAGNDVAICLGANTTLNASGGSSYVWSPATGLSATNISNPVANPTSTTIYTVVVTDGNGCTDTDQVTVTVHNLPTANAGNDDLICPGESTNLLASGGSTFAWSPAAGLSATNIPNPIATPENTTTYTVTVTDANGCTDTDEVTITVNGMYLTRSLVRVSCPGGSDGSIDLTVNNPSGGYTVDWDIDGLGDADDTEDQSGLTAGTYRVIVTDQNCSDTLDVLVGTVNDHPYSAMILTGADASTFPTGPSTNGFHFNFPIGNDTFDFYF